MGRALSCYLRDRVLKASREGASARQAAARFGVSASSAIRRIARAEQGETEPRKLGRKNTSRLDPHTAFIVGLIEDKKDITLDEMVVRLAEDCDMKDGAPMPQELTPFNIKRVPQSPSSTAVQHLRAVTSTNHNRS